MKYIILCGGKYPKWETPRQLLEINGEQIVQRTIRLLKQCGVTDIAITANGNDFDHLGVEIIHHNNPFIGYTPGQYWVDAFPLGDDPVCYMLGDVVYSLEAVQTIVSTKTDSVEFFASSPPFDKQYMKEWAEPFAFKVTDTKHFAESVAKVKQLQDAGKFRRVPIAWELWQVIKDTPINQIDYKNYIAINDYTCDIDEKKDISALEKLLQPRYLIHACESRMWYVEDYLIPSMYEQGIEEVDVWIDYNRDGNLKACLDSFSDCGNYPGGTWHLQDDVIICRDFAQRTKRYQDGVVCGFYHDGFQSIDELWYSFPCIYIPNKMAVEFVEWFKKPEQQERFKQWIFKQSGDDDLFNIFCHDMGYGQTKLNPCLVDHIDYLLGGSIVNRRRARKIIRATFWKDKDLVENLKVKLANR